MYGKLICVKSIAAKSKTPYPNNRIITYTLRLPLIIILGGDGSSPEYSGKFSYAAEDGQRKACS